MWRGVRRLHCQERADDGGRCPEEVLADTVRRGVLPQPQGGPQGPQGKSVTTTVTTSMGLEIMTILAIAI